jgi:hypothetical protein
MSCLESPQESTWPAHARLETHRFLFLVARAHTQPGEERAFSGTIDIAGR